MRPSLLAAFPRAMVLASASAGCIDPSWTSDLSASEPLDWQSCEAVDGGVPSCHLEGEGDVQRVDGLAADVSSSTGRACVVPAPDDVAWALAPNQGSRLLEVGEDEASAAQVVVTACEPAPVGEPCRPTDPGAHAHLFLVAMKPGDEGPCGLLESADFAEHP